MKDFAKSIVCNTKVGNGSGDWRGNFYEDSAGNSASVMKSGKGWEVFWEDARGYGKLVGVYKDQSTARKVAEEVVETEMPDRIKSNYRSQAINTRTGNADVVKDGNTWVVMYAEGTKSKEFDSKEAADKFAKEVGNTKVGNGITKFGLGKYVIADGHKAIVLGEKEERGPNGIPFGWVTIRWVEGPWKNQSDQYYDYDLKKVGNSRVGNANTHLTASNSGELWLNFDGTGEMYDPIELGRYDFSGKSEALSAARELEQLKRKAEQKIKDADKFINAIKNWANGLK